MNGVFETGTRQLTTRALSPRDDADRSIQPSVVVWENTRACDLTCIHCRVSAQPRRSPLELSSEEAFALIDDIASMEAPALVIRGGDPLKREDTYDAIRYASDRGLAPALTASATPLLTPAAVARLKRHGLSRMTLRIDAARAEEHDAFRKVNGSFDITLRAIDAARCEGIPVEINTTVTRRTIDDLPNILALLENLEIAAWTVFFLVSTGTEPRGGRVTAETIENIFGFLFDASRNVSFPIRTTEALHYGRYTLQRLAIENGKRPDQLRDRETGLLDPSAFLLRHRKRAASREASAPTSAPSPFAFAVPENRSQVFVSHTGDVHPNVFLPLKAGDVRSQSLGDLYRSSELLVALRDSNNLRGKCGYCEFREVCGGSRARAWSMTGDVFASDPLCGYQPRIA